MVENPSHLRILFDSRQRIIPAINPNIVYQIIPDSSNLIFSSFDSIGSKEDPYTVNIFITLIYATVSFVRTYFLRRIFEQHGIDDNFIRLGRKGIQKVRERLS